MSYNSDAEILGFGHDGYPDVDFDTSEMSKYALNPNAYPTYEMEMDNYRNPKYSSTYEDDVRLDGLSDEEMPLHPDSPDYVNQTQQDKINLALKNRKTIEDYFMRQKDVYLQNQDKPGKNSNIQTSETIKEHLDNPSPQTQSAGGYLNALCSGKYTVSVLIAVIFILIVAIIVLEIMHARKVHKMVKTFLKILATRNQQDITVR